MKQFHEGSKFLRVEAHFLLPDDFEGTEADAVRLMLDHLERKDLPGAVFDPPKNDGEALGRWEQWAASHNKYRGFIEVMTLQDRKWILEPYRLPMAEE